MPVRFRLSALNMDERDLYWLAGILEGEGSFLCGPPSSPRSCIIAMSTTDKDVAQKVAHLLDGGRKIHAVSTARYAKRGWKQVYSTMLRGQKAFGLMALLRPLMGERRQGQIDVAMASNVKLPPSRHRLKISDEDVGQIRESSLSNAELALKYNVNRSTIGRIKSGERR